MQKILVFSQQKTFIGLIQDQFKYFQIDGADTLNQAYDLLKNNQYEIFVATYGKQKEAVLDLLKFLHDDFFQTKTLLICDASLNLIEKSAIYHANCFDTITHPFLPVEIKHKINYLLSIVKIYPNHTISAGPVSLNPQTGTLVVANKRPKPLRRRETDILACLLRHRPRVVTKNMLIDYVWGSIDQGPAYSTLDVYIRRLRIHLGQFHSLIKTSKGFGYYFANYN